MSDFTLYTIGGPTPEELAANAAQSALEAGGVLLLEYVNGNASDADLAERAWGTASALVAVHVGTAVVPAGVLEEATLLCGSEIFYKRQAPNGIQQLATPEGVTSTRVARDPMLAAYPLLAPFVGMGFA